MKNILKVILVLIASFICAFIGIILGSYVYSNENELLVVAAIFFQIPIICVVSYYIFSKKE